ncbi:hypothetical protein K470DRAFT_263947 [Piedraia hortae CBS 480.64]|uniref:HAT C-terminal dimerisation domain-containing protein n=1 Tax=Piedraia hortae CBS 480.64 TaxID=1314780 RepID=A0A6A7C274_9PEZI|nr:hypothetical protein K470DRAFT_263947 [Piedraia hortae CBS 480.64]
MIPAYDSTGTTLWLHIRAGNHALTEVAQRLAFTPESSVPSEQAFSLLNLIHNDRRNSLSTPTVDKLQTIYIHERALSPDRKIAKDREWKRWGLLVMENSLRLEGFLDEVTPLVEANCENSVEVLSNA